MPLTFLGEWLRMGVRAPLFSRLTLIPHFTAPHSSFLCKARWPMSRLQKLPGSVSVSCSLRAVSWHVWWTSQAGRPVVLNDGHCRLCWLCLSWYLMLPRDGLGSVSKGGIINFFVIKISIFYWCFFILQSNYNVCIHFLSPKNVLKYITHFCSHLINIQDGYKNSLSETWWKE